MVDVLIELETGERDPNQIAREALARYHKTDPSVPLGGMPINDYERLRMACAGAEVTELRPAETEDLGWLHLEHALAALRGAIKPETEAPYTPKEITAMMEAARQTFARMAKRPGATPEEVARARWATASIPLQEEVITRKFNGKISNRYLPHLRSLYQIGGNLLASGDLSPEGITLANTLATQIVLAEYMKELAWLLPAAPRQPWDITAHNTERLLPDQFLLIGREGPEEYTHIPLDILASYFEDSGHPAVALQAILQMDPGFTMDTYRKFVTGRDAKVRYQEMCGRFDRLANGLMARLNKQKRWQLEHGIVPTEEIVRRTSVEEFVDRQMFPEALWYITEYTDETSLEELVHNIAGLEARRTSEGLFPDEQRILASMQLEQAVAFAKAAGTDAKQLEVARNRFGAAMDTLTRAAKAFERSGQLGDAVDVLVTLEGAHVYRALFTSADKYAVKKAVTGYPQKVAELFGLITQHRASIKGDDAQLEQLIEVLTQTAACLLQSAASDEASRHLILPAPERASAPHLTAFVIDCTERVATYDTEHPVGITLVDGEGIKAKPNHVELGRGKLNPDGDPFALLQELAAALGVATAPSKSAKSKKGRPRPQAAVAVVARSAVIDELSQEFGDKIFDASEGVDDDAED